MFEKMTPMEQLALTTIVCLILGVAAMMWLYQNSQERAIKAPSVAELVVISDNLSADKESDLRRSMLVQIDAALSDGVVTNAEFDDIKDKYTTYSGIRTAEKVADAIKD